MQKHPIFINGSDGHPMAADLFLPELTTGIPIVIYAHGFNGFKDWSNFSRIAQPFTDAGLAVLAFNFSHNGTSLEDQENFCDLEKFGNNNYNKQLFDLGKVLEWVDETARVRFPNLDTNLIFLLGHSMGGGMVILKGSTDKRVRKVATWASISHCTTPWGKWTEPMMRQWRKDGVAYYENKRTAQQMPMYYQLHQDFVQNSSQLDILKAAASLEIPFLICHGRQDPSVPMECALLLQMAQPNSVLFIIDGDHVFGRKHPAESEGLPEEMQQVVRETVKFFLRH